MLDVKEVRPKRGNKLHKLASENTCVAEEELQRVGTKIYADVVKVLIRVEFPM